MRRDSQPSTRRPHPGSPTPRAKYNVSGGTALGDRIRAARLERGQTLMQVGTQLDPPRSEGFLSHVELGDRGVSPHVLRQLAAILGASYDEWARLAGYGTLRLEDTGLNILPDELLLWQEFGSLPSDLKRAFLEMARPYVNRLTVRSDPQEEPEEAGSQHTVL